MQQGKGDFIVMPVNAASKLYKAKADSAYVLAAVITHGNLYIVSNEQLTLSNLKGKVIGVIGQGLVPDLTLKAILSDNDLLADVVVGDTATEGKITVRYFAAAPDMLPLLKQGKLSVGLLPEPAATKLKTKVAADKTWYTLDVQELYDEQAKAYPQAVLMVKKSVYEANKEKVEGMGEYLPKTLPG
jgi:NitT/TauT family transport system substrate-binding protein